MKWFRIIAAAVLSLLTAGVPALALADPPVLPPGVLVNIGGRFVHLNCTGHGSPVVVLEAGLGAGADEWTKVQTQVSRFTQVCSYDRPGYGWSDPAPTPRTSTAIVRDLHEALVHSKVPGPYVLVGHSVGGLHVRVFTDQYPGEAAGLVLVDASHERQFEAFRTPAAHLNTAPGPHFILRTVPPPAGGPASSEAGLPAQLTARRELGALRHSAQEAERARLPANIPLVVVTRGKRVWAKDMRGSAREAVWMRLQEDLVRLSTNSEHIIAPQSGHHIHLDQPEMVTAAIRRAIARAQVAASP